MAPFYFILALIIQTLLVGAETDVDVGINGTEIFETNKIGDDIVVKDFHAAPLDWIDLVVGSSGSVYPTSSASVMAQAVLSDKPPEEQLEVIKEAATQITMAIQSEMANLLSYAISGESDCEGGKLRKKRSLESPTDSTQLVMRLLKHIKSNNDYQNIAIEKMMSAQEIADKYGIPFKADPEILTDLAIAGNEQANELTSILKDVCEVNVTKNSDCKPEKAHNVTLQREDSSTNQPDSSFAHYNYYSEPHHHCGPVTPRPSFYDTVSYKPSQDYYSYCSVEPASSAASVFDSMEPLPELVGEEIEETISSKIFVNDEEPGSSTVNHVMSYTVAEKSHFRKPHIEALPQQMQYYFYLM